MAYEWSSVSVSNFRSAHFELWERRAQEQNFRPLHSYERTSRIDQEIEHSIAKGRLDRHRSTTNKGIRVGKHEGGRKRHDEGTQARPRAARMSIPTLEQDPGNGHASAECSQSPGSNPGSRPMWLLGASFFDNRSITLSRLDGSSGGVRSRSAQVRFLPRGLRWFATIWRASARFDRSSSFVGARPHVASQATQRDFA